MKKLISLMASLASSMETCAWSGCGFRVNHEFVIRRLLGHQELGPREVEIPANRYFASYTSRYRQCF